jgi:septal ring factor EnvC (AmiA/AmiB activator)
LLLAIFDFHPRPAMRFVLSLLLLLTLTGNILAQSGTNRAELERRRASILQAIRQTQDELAATKKDKRATMSQLHALQAKLEARQKLIGSINTELSQIDGNIHTSEKEVHTLQSEVSALQQRYAQSIRYAYRNRNSQSMLAFLFSAKDFNDGLRRLSYLRKFRDFRMAQADQIRNVQGNIEHKIGVLNTEKQRKGALLSVEEQQRRVLQVEAQQKDQVVRELKGRESELATDVAKNQKAARNLERAIAVAIRQEIEIARKKAEEEARRREAERRRQEEDRQRALAANRPATPAPTPAASGTGGYAGGRVGLNTGSGSRPATNGGTPPPPPGKSRGSGTTESGSSTPVLASNTIPTRRPAPSPNVPIGLTPEAAALSASFVANRGRLPWPVDKGYIISSYGRHPHPIAEKVMVENDGVDIQTNPGATARAVFEGTVSKTFYVPGFGQNVLINHGEYFTVYNGLASVSVSAGQQVHTKQSIGTVGPNDEGVHVLKFQVWKGASTQNPAGWIAQ